jgi:hypothetical protein
MDLAPIPEALPEMADHEREVRRIWRICIPTAIGVFLAFAIGILISLRVGVPLQVLALVVPVAMMIVIIVFGVGFAVPTAITGMLRLGLTVKMGYESLKMARTTTETVQEIKREASPAIQDLKHVLEQAKPVADVLSRQAQDGYLEKVESHLKSISEGVKRSTSPLKPVTRPTVEG